MKIFHKRIYRKNKDCDEARLKRIVTTCNSYVARQERLPIAIGHTPGHLGDPSFDNANLTIPLDIGDDESATNFSEDGEWIYCDMGIDDVFEDVAKRYHGVSCELWSDDLLSPIALLSINRPKLEVGPMKYALQYSHDGEHTNLTIENVEDTDMNLDTAATKNLIAEVLNASDLAGAVKSLTERVEQLQQQVQAHDEIAEGLKYLMDEQDGGPDEELDEETPDESETEAEAAAETPADEQAEGEKPAAEAPKVEEKDAAGMAMASGTNTAIPTTDIKPDEKEDAKVKKYAELEMAHQATVVELDGQKGLVTQLQERMAAQATETTAKLAELEAKYAMGLRDAQWDNRLIILHERYDFDLEAERKLTKGMTDEQRENHATQVVTKYAMPPTRVAAVSIGDLPKPEPQTEQAMPGTDIPKATVMKVVKYAMDKKMAFEDAYKALYGKGPRDP